MSKRFNYWSFDKINDNFKSLTYEKRGKKLHIIDLKVKQIIYERYKIKY